MPEAREIRVEIQEVCQEYPKPDGGGVTRVLEKVSLTFDKPSIAMLLGPSGCGKSTLLRMVGGVRPIGVKTPTSGRILIDGVPCDDAHEDAVMVFQRYANRPDLTVRENVAFPFRLRLWKRKVPAKEQADRVQEMLQSVGLADKAGLMPAQLSGGQNQRVALARALVLRPRILLMDEPFGALDAQTREEMQHLLVRIFEQQPCLVLFVTHDVTEALLLGDRVIVLSGSPAAVTDDLSITDPRPRSVAWRRSTEFTRMEQQILGRLHAAGGTGQVRVSV